LSEEFVESIERFIDEQAVQRMDTMHQEEEADARATETIASERTATGELHRSFTVDQQADTGN
jgi:hypothetical protein